MKITSIRRVSVEMTEDEANKIAKTIDILFEKQSAGLISRSVDISLLLELKNKMTLSMHENN